MTSHGLFQNPERCDGVIRKLLFEDDQDLYRILSGFFKLRRRGLYLAAIAAFIIVVALLGELGGWQNLNDNDKATYDFGEFSGQADSPILTSVGSTDDVANHFGPFATELSGHDYSFGATFESSGGSHAADNSTSSAALVLASNNAGTAAGTSQGQIDPHAAGAARAAAASPAETNAVVPDSGETVVLLSVALALVGSLRAVLWKLTKANRLQ